MYEVPKGEIEARWGERGWKNLKTAHEIMTLKGIERIIILGNGNYWEIVCTKQSYQAPSYLAWALLKETSSVSHEYERFLQRGNFLFLEYGRTVAHGTRHLFSNEST